MYDNRGVDLNRMREGLEEISSWMSDGVRHYQPCSRTEDNAATIPQIGCQLSSARFTPRPVNCAVLVVNLAETAGAFKKGDLKPLQAIRDLFRCPAIRKSSNPLLLSIYFSLDSRELGLNSCRPSQTCRRKPLLILTHGDMLSAEERIDGRLKLCEYLGVPEGTGAYDIPCLTEQGILPEESDPVTSYALTEAIYRVLIQSDRTHLPTRKPQDWLLIVWSWIMCSIAAFFASLAFFFSKFGPKKIH